MAWDRLQPDSPGFKCWCGLDLFCMLQAMPHLSSTYRPPLGLRRGHVQTILRGLLPGPRVRADRIEELRLADGDRLELHWHVPHLADAPLAVLCHGLEGSAEAGYMRAMARALNGAGCNALAWSYRGCGRLPNLLPRSYHSGATEDLAAVVEHALQSGTSALFLVGFSLGGNLILKYLGEQVPPVRLRAAVAISAPVDLASSADALDLRGGNALYRLRFMRSLNHKAAAKARRFPEQVPQRDWAALRTVRAFDEAFTAPLHGFADAEDYYARCSARPLLENVGVPALLLNALDDPLLAPPSFPEMRHHPHLCIETPAHGGHVAFLKAGRPLRSWTETRVPGFLLDHAGG